MWSVLSKGLLGLTMAAMIAITGYGIFVVADASREISIIAPATVQPPELNRPMIHKAKKKPQQPVETPKTPYVEPRNW